MPKNDKINIELDKLRYREATDRIKIIMGMVDNLLIQHPVFKLHTDLKDLADEANSKLWKAYQLTAKK
jgi:hypothetical protein